MVKIGLIVLIFLALGCGPGGPIDVVPTATPAPTPDPTPTQEAELFAVKQCLTLKLQPEPLEPLSANPCLEGPFTEAVLIATPEDIRHQVIPQGFVAVHTLNAANDCLTPWFVNHRDFNSPGSDERGYRVDISEVCGRFGYTHPPTIVPCNVNLVLKMSTWSSYFEAPGRQSWTGLLFFVDSPGGGEQLAPIGIPNSGFSGNIRVVRFTNCETTPLVWTGLIEVIWASAQGHITIQGLEVLRPEDPLFGNDQVRVIDANAA